MIIHITDDVKIETDYGSSVKLVEYGMAENKKTKELTRVAKTIKYYPDVDMALKAYMKLKLNTSDKEYTDIKDYIKDLTELKNEIESMSFYSSDK